MPEVKVFSGGSNYGTGWGLALLSGIAQGIQAGKAFDIRNATVSKQDWTKMPKPQNANPYLPGRQPTVSQWKPGIADRFKNSNFVNGMIYDVSDDAYVAVKSIFWPVGEITHINGTFASPREMQGAVAMTFLGSISFGEGSAVTKEIVENVAKDGVIQVEKKLPNQIHHFATNKNSTYTRDMAKIADEFGLKLDESWNKKILPHLGRHPNEYHNFVLNGMQKAATGAAGNRNKFLQLFKEYVIKPITRNPELLRKSGW